MLPHRWRRIHGRGIVHRCRVQRIRAGRFSSELVGWFKRRGRRGITRRGLAGLDACCNVELFLLRSAGVSVTVLLAPLVATLPAVVRSAAKGAAEILPVLVAGMREESNPAVAAVYGAAIQTGTNAQGGIQRALILTDKRMNTLVLVPILRKSENLLES